MQTKTLQHFGTAPEAARSIDHAHACTVSFIRLNECGNDLWRDWANVSAHSADQNVFATDWVVRAGVNSLGDQLPLQIARIVSPDGNPVAFTILSMEKRLGRLPLSNASPFTHHNAFVHSMTIKRGWEEQAFSALLVRLAQIPQAPVAFSIGLMPQDSAAFAGLTAACTALKLPLVVEEQFERAKVETKLLPEAYWDETVRSKKRKELRRQWRRLGETGRSL